MASDGMVSVTFGARFERYSLQDGIETIEDAVEKFFGTAGIPTDVAIHVNGDACDLPESTQLRGGDVILLINSALASGGYKQA